MYQVSTPPQSFPISSPTVLPGRATNLSGSWSAPGLLGGRQRFIPLPQSTIQPSVSGVPTIPPLYQNNMSRLPTISRVPLSVPVSSQRILSSRTTNQPIQILTPRTVTTNNPVTIKTTQNVLSSQISTVEKPFNIITTQRVQTPTGTYQVGRTIQPTVRYQQVRTVTPETISYSHPATITRSKRIMVNQPANIITTQNVVQAARPPRIISTSQPVITPVGTSSSAIQDANNFASIVHRAKTKGQTDNINYIMGINNFGATGGGVDRLTSQPLLFQQSTLPVQNFQAQLPAIRIPRTQTLGPQPLQVQSLPLVQSFRTQPLQVQSLPLVQSFRTQPLQVQSLPLAQSFRTQPLQVQSLPLTQSFRTQPLQVQSLRPQTLPTPAFQARTLPVQSFRAQSLPLQLAQPLRTQTGQPISIRTVTTRTYSSN